MASTSSQFTINEINLSSDIQDIWRAFLKQKEEIDGHTKKVLLFLRDKICKFSDITNWLSDKCLCSEWEHKEVSICTRKCGQYKHLLIQNRPNPTFYGGDRFGRLKKRIKKISRHTLV